MTFLAKFKRRKHGAIGIFEPHTCKIVANDRYNAFQILWSRQDLKGYEIINATFVPNSK